jgi:ubiquinone/menaquinone biosynthesis C-methylase UbiE
MFNTNMTQVLDAKYSTSLTISYVTNRSSYRKTDEVVFTKVKAISVTDKIVLDVGCGDGLHCPVFFSLGASKYIGIDIGEDFISMALQNNSHTNAFYKVMNGANMQSYIESNSIDFVFSNFAIHCCAEVKAVLIEISRVLKPNTGSAVLVFNTFDIRSPLSDSVYDGDHSYPTYESYVPIVLGDPQTSSVVVKNIMRSKEFMLDIFGACGLSVVDVTCIDDPGANVQSTWAWASKVTKYAMMFELSKCI